MKTKKYKASNSEKWAFSFFCTFVFWAIAMIGAVAFFREQSWFWFSYCLFVICGLCFFTKGLKDSL